MCYTVYVLEGCITHSKDNHLTLAKVLGGFSIALTFSLQRIIMIKVQNLQLSHIIILYKMTVNTKFAF